MTDSTLDAIRVELFRLRADEASVGPVAASYGRERQAFDWFGSTEAILERLRGLPDDSGPEAIRSEFA